MHSWYVFPSRICCRYSSEVRAERNRQPSSACNLPTSLGLRRNHWLRWNLPAGAGCFESFTTNKSATSPLAIAITNNDFYSVLPLGFRRLNATGGYCPQGHGVLKLVDRGYMAQSPLGERLARNLGSTGESCRRHMFRNNPA